MELRFIAIISFHSNNSSISGRHTSCPSRPVRWRHPKSNPPITPLSNSPSHWKRAACSRIPRRTIDPPLWPRPTTPGNARASCGRGIRTGTRVTASQGQLLTEAGDGQLDFKARPWWEERGGCSRCWQTARIAQRRRESEMETKALRSIRSNESKSLGKREQCLISEVMWKLLEKKITLFALQSVRFKLQLKS